MTAHPTSPWVAQQLREAFPDSTTPRFLIYDNDSIFSDRVTESIKNMGIEPQRTAYRSPWQNGIAKRWVGSARREMLDHVIVMNDNICIACCANTSTTTTKIESTLGFGIPRLGDPPSPTRRQRPKLSGCPASVAFIIAMSGRKQHDQRGHRPHSANQGMPDAF